MGDQDQKFKQNPFPTNFIIPSAPQMRSTRSSIGVRYFLPGRVMSTRNYGVSFHERRLLNLDKFAGSGRVSVSFVGSSIFIEAYWPPRFDKNKMWVHRFLSTYFYRWWESLFREDSSNIYKLGSFPPSLSTGRSTSSLYFLALF